jgi:hypothetical protein
MVILMKKTGITFLLIFVLMMASACTAAGQADSGTVGSVLLADFQSRMKENKDITAQEMADELMTNSVISFSPATMEVEEGLLTGFGNTEITGFTEGVMFAPMIGSIPFVGYIFTLADDTDAYSFVKLLRDNADQAWNICTEAEETTVQCVDRTVFFLMSPKSLEQE